MGRSAFLLAASMALSACGEDAGSGHAPDAPGSVGDAPAPAPPSSRDGGLSYSFPCVRSDPTRILGEATFNSVYLDIFCNAGCTNPFCHGNSGRWGDLELSASIEVAYADLVGKPTGKSIPADNRATCRNSDLLRVVPGSPEQSLLYLKVTGAQPCGVAMPPVSMGFEPISEAAQEQIRAWILAGAPLRAADADAAVVEVDAGLADSGTDLSD